jgi:alkyl sulfatase BDS1-like metallo-beta-lactamase superfamily hydrolase
VLTETAQYLRGIIDQVLPRLNAGEAPDDVFHAVTSDPELASRPYLLELYDHPKFIVRNLIRQWGGWWNGNAADLFPATTARQAAEIAALAGGVGALVARGRDLLASGDLELACHVAEWASRAEPADPAAQALKRDVYDRRIAATGNLMAQGIYRGAMNEAHLALGEERTERSGAFTL